MKYKRVLALGLCLAMLLASVQAEETVSLPVWRSTGSRMELQLSWPESAFFQASDVYDHALARLSLAMSLAAFGGTADAPSAMIEDFFAALGFAAPIVAQYDMAGEDTIATAIAHRTIQNGDETATLVAVAIRGGNYGDEWLSNFVCGTDGDYHAGFAGAAQTVTERTRAYVQEKNLVNPRFWIAGYSRGAAVANLTAAFLQEQGFAPDDAIYAYTFATPRTVRGDLAGRHGNIFNVLNEADIVTHVPLAAWGFGRFGRDLCLPSGEAAEEMLPVVRKMYRQYMDAELGQEDMERALLFTRGAVKGLLLAVQSPEKYTRVYQALMSKAFTGQTLSGSEIVQLGALIQIINNAILREAGVPISLKANLQGLDDAFAVMSPIFQQHVPERYLAWMMSLSDGTLLQAP